MTPLERRCRRLLLAYPAAYRQVRAEEMLDTLLRSSPTGRSWPLPRDCRAMIAGGLQVRAAQNRRLSTAANLLSRGAQRLPRLWLWPPGLVVAVFLLAPVASFLRVPLYVPLLMQPSTLYAWYAMAFLAFAWIVIDARPAVGMAVFLALAASARIITTWLQLTRFRPDVPEQFRAAMRSAAVADAQSFARELLVPALVLVALSAWRLRRQVRL